ncbi:MAG: undecaprenyl-diphosphate phosphatase [Desulfobacterales bacterium]|jgi:undecaprenyl-diphosphatase
MTIVQALLLGVIQGLTEFLPISSSGHLVLTQLLFGLREAELAFDVSVHLGTLIAVMLYFRQDILRLVRALRHSLQRASAPQSDGDRAQVRLAGLLILGSAPTAAIGLALHGVADRLFTSPLMTGVMLLLTGGLLFATRPGGRTRGNTGRTLGQLTLRDALVIGVTQGLAVLPGISRSGSTIAVGILTGIQHETAARFSFLLSIPAVAGAAALVLVEAVQAGNLHLRTCLVGGVTALVVGYASLALLVFLVKKGCLHLFAPYCWIVGGLAIAASL